MSYEIRDALPTDVPGILDIYNDAVRNTTAIWNETPVDLGNRQAWFEARAQQGYPILVRWTTRACSVMPRLATGGRSKAFATPWSTRCISAATSVAKGWGRC